MKMRRIMMRMKRKEGRKLYPSMNPHQDLQSKQVVSCCNSIISVGPLTIPFTCLNIAATDPATEGEEDKSKEDESKEVNKAVPVTSTSCYNA